MLHNRAFYHNYFMNMHLIAVIISTLFWSKMHQMSYGGQAPPEPTGEA